jgi:hypothetical protein
MLKEERKASRPLQVLHSWTHGLVLASETQNPNKDVIKIKQ